MSDQLPAVAGGSTVAPADAGAIARVDEIGDLSVDRGASAPTTASTKEADNVLWADFSRHVRLDPTTERAVRLWLENPATLRVAESLRDDRYVEGLLAEDARRHQEVERTFRGEWGAAYEANVDRIRAWVEAQGEDFAEEIYRARDVDGTALCNKPSFVRALLGIARPTAPTLDEETRTARRHEIERWMGAPKGTPDYNRYWNDATVQKEYHRLLQSA